MIIGTLRPEEARVFDIEAGTHQFHGIANGPVGSFDVFWHNGGIVEDGACEGEELGRLGWYWSERGEAHGPFGTSMSARADANPAWLCDSGT